MNASHESSRKNFENSTPELDLLVSIAQQLPGVLGARLTGGGFGGATITLCQRFAAVNIAAELSERYRHESGIISRVVISTNRERCSLSAICEDRRRVPPSPIDTLAPSTFGFGQPDGGQRRA